MVSWEAVTAIATVILAAATVVLATGIPLELIRANRTLKEQRYAHFVGRYQRIISHLPYNIFAKGNKIAQVDEKAKVWLLAYLDLCAEELFDRQRNAIETRVWNDWAAFIRDDFGRSKPLQELFAEVKDDYPHLSNFLTSGEVPPLLGDEMKRFSNLDRFGQTMVLIFVVGALVSFAAAMLSLAGVLGGVTTNETLVLVLVGLSLAYSGPAVAILDRQRSESRIRLRLDRLAKELA